MLRWLAVNLRTFLLAFALAVAVWVTAVTAANPDVTGAFPRAVPIEYVGQDPSLIISAVVPKDVQVTLRAPQSIWNSLIAGDVPIRAVVDLSGLSAGTHNVSVQVQIDTRPVRTLSVSPQTFSVVMEPLITKSLAINLAMTGEPAISYKAGDVTMDALEATISGPKSLVDQVKDLQAVIDLTNARQSIDAFLPIQVLTDNSAILTKITIHPSGVNVHVPIVQQGGYRDLAVKVVTVGKLASGYRLNNVTASPPIVTVYSQNIPLIQSLPGYVETTMLDLSGASSNIDTRLSLNLPGGVTLIGDQAVSVQIEIVPIEGSMTVSFRPVEVIGLGLGLDVDLSPTTVDVILSGPIPILDSLLPSDVTIQVDLAGLAPGTYQLIPKVSVKKNGVTLQSILPGTVEVTISKKARPTP